MEDLLLAIWLTLGSLAALGIICCLSSFFDWLAKPKKADPGYIGKHWD